MGFILYSYIPSNKFIIGYAWNGLVKYIYIYITNSYLRVNNKIQKNMIFIKMILVDMLNRKFSKYLIQ